MSGYHERNWEPFPMDTIKRVERPTTVIYDDQIKQVDERESGFNRAFRGDFGERLSKEVRRFVQKQPVSGALLWMTSNMVNMVDGLVAVQKAPLPEDTAAISRHIKELAYFLRADAVGICKLPSYAIYTHKFPKGDPIELNHTYAIAVLVDQDWRTANAFTGSDWISNGLHHSGVYPSSWLSGPGPSRQKLPGGGPSYPSLGRAWRDEQDWRLCTPSIPGTSV